MEASLQWRVNELFRLALVELEAGEPLVTTADPRFGDYQCAFSGIFMHCPRSSLVFGPLALPHGAL